MNDRWENLAAGAGVVVRDEPAVGSAGARIMCLRPGCMLCARCSALAETALSELPGVLEASLDWEADRVIVEYDASLVGSNGNGMPAGEAEVVKWAVRLIQAIESEAKVANHAACCGKGADPKFLI